MLENPNYVMLLLAYKVYIIIIGYDVIIIGYYDVIIGLQGKHEKC